MVRMRSPAFNVSIATGPVSVSIKVPAEEQGKTGGVLD